MALREWAELYKTAMLRPEQFCCIHNDQLASRLTAELCDGSFLDIGAHIGSSTAAVLRRHPNAHVIAIEAVPQKAAWLRKRFPSIDVRQYAVADRRGRATFYVDIDRPGYSSLISSGANAQDAREAIEVQVIPLDELLPTEFASLVKIDVEGAEYAVLQGASNFTARCRPVFVFESGPWAQAEGIWQWFCEREYAICAPFRVAHEDDGMSLPAFLEGHHYPRLSTNYLAIPREKLSSLRNSLQSAASS
jgi:FkbM family methyltransferase